MNIVDKKLNEIEPYGKNPRKNDKAVKYVAESIKQFGFKVPIVIDRNGIIVAGHTRYKAARQLHLNSVPCLIADDLTDEQIRAYRLADNKVGELSEWDDDLLAEELKDIFDIDMQDLGFEDLNLENEPTAIEDDFEPILPEEPKAQRGEIYLLGNHRLMCGDSTKIEDVRKLVGGGRNRFTSYRSALQCRLHRKDQRRFEDRKRQNGRFTLSGIFKRCVFCC